MNDAYYHGFEIGFNWWYLFAIVALVILAIAGVKQYYVRENKVRSNYGEKLYLYASLALTGIFIVMVVMESFDGIVQFFDNHLASGESPLTSIICALVAVFMATLIFFAALYFTGVVAGLARYGWLHKQLKRARKIAKLGQSFPRHKSSNL